MIGTHSPPILLAAENIDLYRAGRHVLKDVTADFERGVVTAVVGPSGAGKTSLLRCLNGLEQPQRGRIWLGGKDVQAIDPVLLRRRVGMIFQTPVLFEGGVRDNLAYGTPGVAEWRMAEVLEAAALASSFLERESSALSVGQAQRVCIARALVREPEVLLMDEPTSALDRNARAQMERLIVDLSSSGLTIVLVTHDLDQARRVAGKALLLIDGRIAASGNVEQIEAAW